MSKYIDYDAIDYRHDKLHDKSSEFLDGVIYMAERIENAPSIDIVRCKECKHRLTERIVSKNDPHWIIYEVGDCRRMLGTVKDDDFCSYGERKESE